MKHFTLEDMINFGNFILTKVNKKDEINFDFITEWLELEEEVFFKNE
jgi:hypothetical protein